MQNQDTRIVAYESRLFERLLQSLTLHGLESCACSVILTGSFGRGEATYRLSDSGVSLVSDVEVGIVFRHSGDKKRAVSMIQAVQAEFSEDLNLMPFPRRRIFKKQNYNHTVFTPYYKTLFTYDLFHGSRTIWGEDLLHPEGITLSQVDPYEAKRIVANRIGELVCTQSGGQSEAVPVWQAKLLLAVGSAVLLCKNAYESSYRAQKCAIIKLEKELTGLFGSSFLEDYTAAFVFLRENGEFFSIEEERLRQYVSVIRNLFQQTKIRHPKTNSFSRSLKNNLKYLRTGMKFGVFGMEDRILQALIDEYSAGEPAVFQTAALWQTVLY